MPEKVTAVDLACLVFERDPSINSCIKGATETSLAPTIQEIEGGYLQMIEMPNYTIRRWACN